ncbi:MAG: FixH family protein [Rhodospirillaceae bacterium]
MIFIRTASAAAMAVLGLMILPVSSFAAGQDYKFELVAAKPADNNQTDVSVKLIHIPDAKPVTDAKIVPAKMDMGPSGMAGMSGKVAPQDIGKDGLYHFLAAGGMAGKWQLTLDATVKGEPDTIHGSVVFASK